MKFICILLLLSFSSVYANGPDCTFLKVKLLQSDKMDAKADASYGDGDDDLFSAEDVRFYHSKSQDKNIHFLNDYDLTKAFTATFNEVSSDTIHIIINFPGLAKSKMDTLIVVNCIDIINGNRSNKTEWMKSGTVKDLKVLHNGKLIGCATLQQSYKMQSVLLNNAPVVNHHGKIDTISLVISSIYPGKISGQYSISEIKLGGIRKY